MHNNFYFLRKLCDEIRPLLSGSVISECFSQSRDELVIRFEASKSPLFIRASLLPGLQCLSFPEQFARARKNSVDLFASVIGLRVANVRQYENERSFSIQLSDGFLLLFKMHGNHSNIVLFENDRAVELFRTQLQADMNINPMALDRTIDFSRQAFEQHIHSPDKHYFTFGKVIWAYLNHHGFATTHPEEKWKMIQSLIFELENPAYIITELNHKLVLSLVPFDSVHSSYSSPVQALSSFFTNYSIHTALTQEKQFALSKIHSELKQCKAYISKTLERLKEVEADDHYRRWADLIIANLHVIQPGTATVSLPDLLDETKLIEIRLKPEHSPQKNAELYYRKARNRHIETEKLSSGLQKKKNQLRDLEHHFNAINTVTDLKELRRMANSLGFSKEGESQPVNLPYRSVEYKGYMIWIGKSAKDNDVLTLKYAYKEDLWLHAKDVPGSHVIVKFQAGHKFPKEVIERAAALAAFYSKRKNESLCPVIYTPKKFVRKRKGDAPGTVAVEKEKVIMVEPAG